MTDENFPPADDAPATGAAPAFTAVPLRRRRDGWTPDRQVAFIDALAECGCVTEACARVGLSVASAYALQRRPEAASFRRAWDCALDHAVVRLSDAVFARAIHGVATPVFYKGEQIGERRRYDERLAMFLLRHRDPTRYGKWADKEPDVRHRDAPAATLGLATLRVRFDAEADADGLPRPRYRQSLPGYYTPWDTDEEPSADHDDFWGPVDDEGSSGGEGSGEPEGGAADETGRDGGISAGT